MHLKSRFATIAAGALLALTATAGSASAAPSTQALVETGSENFTSESCVSQINALAAEKVISESEAAAKAQELCNFTVTTKESAPVRADASAVAAEASAMKLSKTETGELMTAAAAGQVYTTTWEHSYWGGSLLEKHRGTTYYNGTHAWISSAGNGGYHECHSEGGIAIGWAVTSFDCTLPGASAAADAYYRFDAGAVVQNSPITLNVGLHYQIDRNGNSSSWQVGG